ncbi:MAG: sodium:calcium antiporter [Rhodothalassiaceae bacterium]
MVSAIVILVLGLVVLIFFSEQLVKATVGTSLGFGLSPFLISVIFIGFDPENLALGVVAAREETVGLALGSILGAAMVAVALAFGLTALIVPMRFATAPAAVLAVPPLALILLYALCLDGRLGRIDGAVLLAGFSAALIWLIRLSRRGADIKAGGEVAETLQKTRPVRRWRAAALLLVALVAIVVASELVVVATRDILALTGLSGTVVGMSVLALAVSLEELGRELPAALKGRPDISYGNVAGSALAFFLFNAGLIALAAPLPVSGLVLRFYFPLCLAAVLVVTVLMALKTVPRAGGALLVALYIGFFVGGYLL